MQLSCCSLRKLVSFLSISFLLAGCAGLGGMNSTTTPSSSGNHTGDIHSINHIIFMVQENRSFDHYFGNLNAYRQAQSLPADVDVAPPGVTNPGGNGAGPIARFHFTDKCMEL